MPISFRIFQFIVIHTIKGFGIVNKGEREELFYIYIYIYIYISLDSILKSRDITLPTKVRLVKAIVFPVVIYGCDSWTIKEVER